MQLGGLMDACGFRGALGEGLLATAVTGLAYDSRLVQPGDLFVALLGANVDARAFASQAMDRGAVAVVSEAGAPAGFEGPWIQVDHGRRALALMARHFYAEAVRGMKIAGVTGTNGKTTTTMLLNQILRTAGLITVLIGTIEYQVAGRTLPAKNTTPESLDLYRLFAEGSGAGARYAVMEASSHALAQERVAGIHFDAAVWTNLTQDHLDFHRTMEAYFEAKESLFRPGHAAPPRVAVLNADDAWARKIRTQPQTRVVWYSARGEADARAAAIESRVSGLEFDLLWQRTKYRVRSPLAGKVNVQNCLAAFAAAVAMGVEPETAVRGVAECRSVPGRFETVDAGQPFTVVVDYAHTEDALRNTLAAARQFGPRRVITVFGCGGDRDRAKRPRMGQTAAALSDFVIVTSDNPRSEDPAAIINDVLVGLQRTDTPHAIEPDRGKAIRRAITEAGPSDLILIAGKGHETYQVLKDRVVDFDDRAVARRLLQEFGYRKERA